MQSRLTGPSKLPAGVNVSVDVCVYMSALWWTGDAVQTPKIPILIQVSGVKTEYIKDCGVVQNKNHN